MATINADDPDELERDLTLKAVSGDAVALQRLLIREHPKLLAFVRALIPPTLTRLIDPADIVQDAFFDAIRRIGAFVPHGRDALHRWLLTLARRRLISVMRAQRAAKRGGGAFRTADDDGEMASLLERVAVDSKTPSRTVADRELQSSVHAAVLLLPDHYRMAVTLRYFEGLSIAQVASRMGKTEAALHMLYGRALRAMRLQMRSASAYA